MSFNTWYDSLGDLRQVLIIAAVLLISFYLCLAGTTVSDGRAGGALLTTGIGLFVIFVVTRCVHRLRHRKEIIEEE